MNFLNNLIPNILRKRIKDKLGVPSQSMSINNIKLLGFSPKTILDIGAYEGSWTEEMRVIFPESKFLMIEAQESKRPKLEDIVSESDGKIEYQISLLGAENNKEIIFNEYETASSVLMEHYDTGSQQTSKNLRSLDSLVISTDYERPDFIKLDTQGYELEILKGGKNALSFASMVLMEVSFIDIYKNGPLIFDVINFMNENNFQVYDICTLMRRPLDKALFQADVLFIKKDHFLLSNKRWA